MENQASLVNTEATTTDEINTDPISNTQNIDIYEVQPGRNKALKLLALHILKHLPDDMFTLQTLDVSSIKSNEAIPDYGPCMECDIPILTEDPPRSLVLNVCGDMIHQTYTGKIHKDGTLLCSCGKADHSDPLLPFQYSIVDYGGREKSSIPESERPSFVNLRNLGYNILKSLEDKTVRDIDFPELAVNIFFRLCIENRLFLGTPSACPAPDCGKSVDILDETGIIFNPDPRVTFQLSGILPSMGTFALSSPPIRMLGIEGPVTQQDKSQGYLFPQFLDKGAG
ncbi:13934_t:CDS:2 [Funneliformis geosporum]|nr:13934_t:CDS:2 [Funneliformis geosporum]